MFGEEITTMDGFAYLKWRATGQTSNEGKRQWN